jgi:peptidoglycan hydrolase-like protein with peptidoglycan-binding domain
MSWRVAASLLVLRDEMNAMAPNRSKVSDGTIGDAAHAATVSDHNPNAAGVVCAFDITHDPAHGADMGQVSEFIRTHPHPSCTYLIFNRRIASAAHGWIWRIYLGSSPHTEHLHVSASHDYDNKTAWGLANIGAVAPLPPPAPSNPSGAPPLFPLPAGEWFGPESTDPRNHSGFFPADAVGVRQYQSQMSARGWVRMPVTGRFDAATFDLTKRFQQEKNLTVDGGVGLDTWNAAWTAPIQ